jgi:hypothetical protein
MVQFLWSYLKLQCSKSIEFIINFQTQWYKKEVQVPGTDSTQIMLSLWLYYDYTYLVFFNLFVWKEGSRLGPGILDFCSADASCYASNNSWVTMELAEEDNKRKRRHWQIEEHGSAGKQSGGERQVGCLDSWLM